MSTKTNFFPKLLLGMVVLLTLSMYSCNNSSSKEEKKDTVAAPADTTMKMNDTTMKMQSDTLKKDTSGKGGQPTPTGH